VKTEALRDDTVSPVAATEDLAGEVSLRPKTLAEYVGQANVRENLDIAIRAARARHEPSITSC
jgi:Holliday junction DNA helicase RuvB